MTVHFLLERETKGAIRYFETTSAEGVTPFDIKEGAKIGTLYVRKSAFPEGKIPLRLEVEIKGI